MSKSKNPNRNARVGKTRAEMDAYQRFINSRMNGNAIEKTVDDKEDSKDTRGSAIDAKSTPEDKDVTPKSVKLRVTDWLRNNYVNGIIVGVAVLVISGTVSFYLNTRDDLNIAKRDIEDLQEDVKTLDEKYTNTIENYHNTDKNLELFKTEVNKDLEFINKKLEDINTKIGN